MEKKKTGKKSFLLLILLFWNSICHKLAKNIKKKEL